MGFLIGFVILMITLLSIESHLRKITKQNKETIELLKQIIEKNE